MNWMYLSFASDAGFLDGCVVRAKSIDQAVREAHRLGINPGGDVLGLEVPAHMIPQPHYRERLMTKDEIRSMEREMLS